MARTLLLIRAKQENKVVFDNTHSKSKAGLAETPEIPEHRSARRGVPYIYAIRKHVGGNHKCQIIKNH